MISHSCLTPHTIGGYVAGTLDEASQEAVERHIDKCARCGERVELVQRVANAGDDVAASVEEVAGRVARLLAEPQHRWALLAKEPFYREPAIARRLLTLAIDERDRDPRRAASMAHAAGVIGSLLAVDARPALQMRFEAWSLESALLREAGRYSACGAALVRAEEAAAAADNPELAGAIVLLGRALLCSEPDVWHPDEALALLDRADPVFTRFDGERRLRALTVRGMILLRSGEAEAAKEAFQQVFEATAAANEMAHVDAATNLAAACIATGSLHRAERLLAIAEEFDRRHHRHVCLARDLVHRARLQRALGLYEQSVRSARSAMRWFEKAGMDDEAIRSGLAAVFALVSLSRIDAAMKLCASIAERSIALDVAEPSRRRALTAEALAYLRELASRRALSADVVASVETYIEKISMFPPTPFAPPVPLQTM